MTIRRNRSKKGGGSKKAPVTRRKPKNIPEFVSQRISTYKGHIISFSELNQSNDEERKLAVDDFVQAMFGDARTERQSRYADVIDSIPILGDIAQLFIIARTEAEYQKYQLSDFLVGLFPIIGDIADYLFTPDTNKKIAEMRLRQEYYNSLIAMGKTNEANAYLQQVESDGHHLRLPKQKELDVVLGLVDGRFKKLDEWENEKIAKVANTWATWGIFSWRKLNNKPRIGANDRVQINPKAIESGLDKTQKGAKTISMFQKIDTKNLKEQAKAQIKQKAKTEVNKKKEEAQQQGKMTVGNFIQQNRTKINTKQKQFPA